MENRFIKNNETIIDIKNNYEWKLDWEQIKNFNEIKSMISEDKSVWHIPSIDEFKSLSENLRKLPSSRYLKKIGFQNIKNNSYWTSNFINDKKNIMNRICFDFYFFTYSDFKGTSDNIKDYVTLVRKIN